MSMGVVDHLGVPAARAVTKISGVGYQGYVTMQNDNGIGVSIVGHTSNGQTPFSDLNFYTPPGMTVKKNGDTMMYTYPINNNRGVATGSIQMKPGSISVSSSTYTKSPTFYWPNIPRLDPIMPMFNNFIFPPINYRPPNVEPWFARNMINSLDRLKPVLKNPFMQQNLDQLLNVW
ncbi:hypothetical protein RR46_02660 [Papilio xuthus]|uniref:Uncharacterized protein n=1 Tax=Papilio xuthus TaxID=66420 RepID=A0A194Q402_PAPXU|nr:hypothetical protein RR46_02660 [Papilio xuthus]